MPNRIQKVNSLINQQVSEIISWKLNLKPGVFLTISKVDTTKDLRYAYVSVSVFPESEENYIMKTLKKEKHSIQKELNKNLHMKVLPKIQFKYDKTEANADKIEKILKQL